MPGRTTIWRWCREFPEFGTNYARAREISTSTFEDRALRNATNAKTQDEVRAATLALSTIEWVNKVRNRHVYGDRSQLEVKSTITLSQLVEGSLVKTIEHEAQPQIPMDAEKPVKDV
jgi:hypothetical protein